eukprot:TRINITY_DN12646_c0_g1_i1.p1 TRINITY_DN12646_c0_g1~~TRINITY_DN12646_c0_g1_i1.p1  ORF type:complete len:147 (-),score=29.96 TRINITY_DN12646_c0_g1_i1:29-469(-)
MATEFVKHEQAVPEGYPLPPFVIVSQFPCAVMDGATKADKVPCKAAMIDQAGIRKFFTKTFSSIISACCVVIVNWVSEQRLQSLFGASAAAEIVRQRKAEPFADMDRCIHWATVENHNGELQTSANKMSRGNKFRSSLGNVVLALP